MITNITKDLKVPGIYKITYDNGKIYIGQALNIWSRAHEHNSKNRYPCDQALKRHKATIEILETVNDITELDQVESKWILFYNSTNKEIGYNIIAEGNASGKHGVNNCNAAFSKEELHEIQNLLLHNTEISISEIAHRYNVNAMTIIRISKGYSYFDPNLSYPLRNNNHDSQKKGWQDYFSSEDEIYLLKDDLKYRWDLSIETDLAVKYNIPLKLVRDINLGRRFEDYGEYSYPIRQKNVRNNKNFSYQDVLDILYDLRYTSMPATQIAKKYNIHRDTVAAINKGLTYYIKDYDYPAR